MDVEHLETLADLIGTSAAVDLREQVTQQLLAQASMILRVGSWWRKV